MSPEGSFKKYRDILYSSPPPRIPFLYVFISILSTLYCFISFSIIVSSMYLIILVFYLFSFFKNTYLLCFDSSGVCLSDLTFLEDGNQDFLGDGLINIHKRRMVYKAIEEVQQCQLMPFLFEKKEIHELLTELPVLSENDLFALSLAREPREKPKTAALRRLASVRASQDNSFTSQAAKHIEQAEAAINSGGSTRIKSTTISPGDSPGLSSTSGSTISPPTSPRGAMSSSAATVPAGPNRPLNHSGGGGASVTLSPRSMTLTPRSSTSLSSATGTAMRSPPTSPRRGN